MASAAIFLSQHLAVFTIFALKGRPFAPPWWFWAAPPRALVQDSASPEWVLLAAMAAILVVDGLLVVLALRRARDAGYGEGLAAFVVVPILQAAVMLALSLKVTAPTLQPAAFEPERRRAFPVVAVIVGAALSLGAVAVNAVWLAVYGWTLFIASPFLIGLVTGYVANIDQDIGLRRSFMYVVVALLLGALAVLLMAWEGVICLILASPLIAGAAWIGAVVGRSTARAGVRGRSSTVASIAILPIFYLGEVILPPQASFDDTQSIVVDAPPMAVWDAVIHMGPIPDAPAPPFGWGLAYPVDGKILGEGPGAIRIGYFSTGVAYERVTDWRPGHLLAFDVLSDPPSMRELSPYAHVNAPHVSGYFRTTNARFDIMPLTNGRTRLSLTTHHDLDLEPALYWEPIATWAVDANKRRVLSHFARQAEAAK